MTDDQGEYRGYRNQRGPGKGDRNRIADLDAYRTGWERIFGKKNARNKQSSKTTRKGN